MTVDTKDINPDGSCCFCMPLRPGAIAITLILAFFITASSLNEFIIDNYYGGIVYLSFAIANYLGTFLIYFKIHRWIYLSTLIYTVSICTYFLYALHKFLRIDCNNHIVDGELIPTKKCEQKKSSNISGLCLHMFLLSYFSYVLFDYAFKLRRAASKTGCNPTSV